MGSKPSNNFQSDRPESGGADKDMLREKSGLPDRDKERYAEEQAKRRDAAPRDQTRGHDTFSIDNEPNNDRNQGAQTRTCCARNPGFPIATRNVTPRSRRSAATRRRATSRACMTPSRSTTSPTTIRIQSREP